MMQKPKGKQGTKGQKQIYEENQSTLKMYFYALVVVHTLFYFLLYFAFWPSASFRVLFAGVLTTLIGLGSYQAMVFMAKATLNGNHVVDAGIDLNMEQGFGEHLKDLIILTSILQCLALISYHFWWFLLLIPAVAFYKLWVNILGPWFFAPAPEDTIDEKKQRKLERKSKRVQYARG